MRYDAVGFFWDDTPPPKPPSKAKIKRTPPEPVWLKDSYLPYLDEAIAFQVELFNHDTIRKALANNETLVFDIEIYRNYFLIAFKSVETGRVCYFEFTNKEKINTEWLVWLVQTFKLVSFNGIKFDIPILKIMLVKPDTSVLKDAADSLIKYNVRPHELLKKFKKVKLNLNHIDLYDVSPLQASLKIYGGRLHCRRMQDLPFDPDTILTPQQMAIVRLYCINDLDNTILLYNKLRTEISIREDIGSRYNLDVRSKSDPQVAETVIIKELGIRNVDDYKNKSTKSVFNYRVPDFIQFKSDLLNYVLDIVKNETYIVGLDGKVVVPESITKFKIDINGTHYQMGNGGLHSTEESIAYKSDENYTLVDRDVVSYYPMIVIVLGLFPTQLGRAFSKIFKKYVYERISAKQNGDDKLANMLKIFINGIFGKFGSIFSVMFAPDLLIQVTMTGQLALLMLIERLELVGIHVISGNTDGIVIYQPNARRREILDIIAQWEKDTGFTTEETVYKALYSRDINNYIAIYDKPKKGEYAKNKGFFRKADLSKNAVNTVCVEAVTNFLVNGTAIEETVKKCTDITQFLTIRKVKFGGVKVWSDNNIEYLGKAVRWYYSSEVDGEIVSAPTGNKVAKSEGARPLMQLPDNFPKDVNYDWYIKECYDMLNDLGYKQ